MFQLLTSKTRISDPVKDKWLGEAVRKPGSVSNRARVVEIMGLMGDASDNIPGVKGIGEKTAVKLIMQFGTIEEVLRRVKEVTPTKTKNLLLEQGEQARLSKRLATIQVDCPFEFAPDQFQARAPHTETLVALLRELEFMTLAKAFRGDTPEQNRLGSELEDLRDDAAAISFLARLRTDEMVSLACVLTGEPGVRADIGGCALGLPDGGATFLRNEARSWPRPIGELLRNAGTVKAAHDFKTVLSGPLP